MRRTIDALPERILICRRSGVIVCVNTLAEVLLGRSAEELEGQRVDLILPESLRAIDGAPALEHLVALRRGETVRGAILHRRGVHIEVELAASLFAEAPTPEEELLAVVLRQIPEQALRRDHEGAVHAETYRRVFEDAPVGIFHFDERGVITACNEPFVRIIGSSKRVLVGLAMTTLPFRPIAEAVKQALTGKLARFEGTYPSATSDKLTQVRVEFAPIVDGSGRTVGGVGIAEDVTDRVRAEQAVRRSFESLRTLIENAPDAIAVHRGDKFLLVNSALVRTLGYDSAADLLATSATATIHPSDRDLALTRRHEIEDGGLPGPSTEMRLLRKDGGTVVAEMASIPVHFEDQPAVLTFARDVTERRRVEASLAQADRMASIGTLAAGVAHEINNPLAYVIANLDVMERKLGAPDELHALLRDAREGCERVRSIVRDLRTFSRAESDKAAPVDVRRVVDVAINMAQVEIRHRARLIREDDDVPAVMGDETRLGQVVLNLLLNAAQAIPEDSTSHTIRVGTRKRGGRVEIFVSDDGEGIPNEVLGRLFEPFFTTKPAGIGTGLGLSICRGIVQAHSGSIETEVGRGSTFYVLLPAIEAPRAARGSGPPPSTSRRARIVVIDDEVLLGTALRSALHQHDVALATSGREGLQLLLSGPAPDLILCDVMMPDVSGLGVYEALRRDRPELCDRFAFMTGGVFPEPSIQFIAGPGALKLHKPFEIAEVERLLARVRSATAA
ncbi:MAG: PAS domain S-box protein [Deltaproteobacteria bacterium]|nr:PAS domain S-box protein [Deltaproteobacteria bacterium]